MLSPLVQIVKACVPILYGRYMATPSEIGIAITSPLSPPDIYLPDAVVRLLKLQFKGTELFKF
jgi:hypothetical protein